MYSIVRKLLAIIITLFLNKCAMLCCNPKEIFSEKVDAFLQKIPFVTNLYFIASLFALAAFVPWLIRYIDFRRTSDDVKEKYRRKRDRFGTGGIKTHTKSSSLIYGIILAVIFFLISKFGLEFAAQGGAFSIDPSLTLSTGKIPYAIERLNFLCCLIPVFTSHLDEPRPYDDPHDYKRWL